MSFNCPQKLSVWKKLEIENEVFLVQMRQSSTFFNAKALHVTNMNIH